jgi:hypothetical protein
MIKAKIAAAFPYTSSPKGRMLGQHRDDLFMGPNIVKVGAAL